MKKKKGTSIECSKDLSTFLRCESCSLMMLNLCFHSLTIFLNSPSLIFFSYASLECFLLLIIAAYSCCDSLLCFSALPWLFGLLLTPSHAAQEGIVTWKVQTKAKERAIKLPIMHRIMKIKRTSHAFHNSNSSLRLRRGEITENSSWFETNIRRFVTKIHHQPRQSKQAPFCSLSLFVHPLEAFSRKTPKNNFLFVFHLNSSWQPNKCFGQRFVFHHSNHVPL